MHVKLRYRSQAQIKAAGRVKIRLRACKGGVLARQARWSLRNAAAAIALAALIKFLRVRACVLPRAPPAKGQRRACKTCIAKIGQQLLAVAAQKIEGFWPLGRQNNLHLIATVVDFKTQLAQFGWTKNKFDWPRLGRLGKWQKLRA